MHAFVGSGCPPAPDPTSRCPALVAGHRRVRPGVVSGGSFGELATGWGMARGTSTVLFTDLVGSTDLSVRFGEAFDEARRAHDAALRTVVEAHAGAVVKGTGDGVMATFDGVADGVAAARAAQQAIHRLNRRRREPALAIRVGLSVGDVSFEDGDYYGEPVVQAARLCALADGEQILATSVVQALAGGSARPGSATPAPTSSRACPGPSTSWRSSGSVPRRRPRPSRRAWPPSEPSFVGRTDELGLLDQRVPRGGGRPRATDRAHRRRARRRQDHASSATPSGAGTTRARRSPWVGARRTSARRTGRSSTRSATSSASAPDEVLRGHVERHGAGLLPLVPGPGRSGRAAARARRRRPRDRAVPAVRRRRRPARRARARPRRSCCSSTTSTGPTPAPPRCCAAWPRPPTRPGCSSSARCAATSWPREHPMGQALAAFHRVAAVTRLQLDGLAQRRHRRARGALDRRRRRGAGAERLADALVAETGGNAFFVTEVVRHLDETGQLARPGRRPARARRARARERPGGPGRARRPPRLAGRHGPRRRRRHRQRVHPAAARRGHRRRRREAPRACWPTPSAAALVREVGRRARPLRVHARPRAARDPRQPRRHPRGGAAPPRGRGARGRPRGRRARSPRWPTTGCRPPTSPTRSRARDWARAGRRRRARRARARATPWPSTARRSCCTTSCATTTRRRGSTCSSSSARPSGRPATPSTATRC